MAALLVVKLSNLRDTPPGVTRAAAPGVSQGAASAVPAPTMPGASLSLISSAAASAPAPRPAPAPPAAAPASEPPSPEALAERAILETLRARRVELEAREAQLAGREMLVTAMERRVAARLEELTALQSRLEAEARGRDERTEQGWRQMVRLYEGMRPRDAAGIFDELEMPVLVQVVDRMREAKAAPILAAMRQDRARTLTTELARHRSGGGT
jgi:flagellar motility protein MotE (MotC chaperone)